MLLESPFSRIQGTSVRRSSMTPNPPGRRPHSSGSSGTNVSRQASMTSITPSTLTAALQRADSAPQVPTRSSLPGLMRNTSLASALGSLAGFAMGTQSTDHTAPPSPSQSQTSDIDVPPGPACNLARYISPYKLSSSPESVGISSTPSLAHSSSLQSIGPMSPTSNGYGYSLADVTSRFSPADIVSYLIVKDLIKFSTRRRPETDNAGRERPFWEDFKIDEGQLSDIDKLGLDAGASLLQILPLKSKLYDWALEYYKEPQMRVSDAIWYSKFSSLVSLAT
jgi:regulator-associated protein of mTOR